jgi:nitroreductase
MKVLDVIENRRSKRAMSNKPIDQEVVGRLIHAASLAPSCFNNQPWRFIAIQGSESLNAVAESLSRGNYWAKSAPLAIAVVTKIDEDCRSSHGRDYAFFDTGMAAMNLLLQAQEEGLYSHYIAGFNPQPLSEALGISEDWTLLTLGFFAYPGDPSTLNEDHQKSEASPRSRKKESEYYFREKWPSV